MNLDVWIESQKSKGMGGNSSNNMNNNMGTSDSFKNRLSKKNNIKLAINTGNQQYSDIDN
jgi:hypothetical protein